MPTIVDYPIVRDRLLSRGLVCNYFNGGAFGFARTIQPAIAGWIGPDDPSIRPEMKAHIRQVPPPHERVLAGCLARAWEQANLGGSAWVMPMAHWAFELDFGSTAWMPRLLDSIGVDAEALRGRRDAAAVAFTPDEAGPLQRFTEGLLAGLTTSDFIVIFPDTAALCIVHHHRQLWWMVEEPALLASLKAALDGS